MGSGQKRGRLRGRWGPDSYRVADRCQGKEDVFCFELNQGWHSAWYHKTLKFDRLEARFLYSGWLGHAFQVSAANEHEATSIKTLPSLCQVGCNHQTFVAALSHLQLGGSWLRAMGWRWFLPLHWLPFWWVASCSLVLILPSRFGWRPKVLIFPVLLETCLVLWVA